MTKKIKIGIIGGGASGMMCLATILESQSEKKLPLEIHLFDKNPKIGVKVAITGGGRCNVTTGVNDINVLLSKYIRGSKFLKPSLLAFPPVKVQQWIEDHGVKLKEEDDGRVFPVSDKGEDVVEVFEKISKDERVFMHLEENVLSVSMKKEKFCLTTSKTSTKKSANTYDILVVTTGGNAYQQTGSTGDGFELAKSLGHNITSLCPSLNGFTTQEIWCQELAGVNLQNVRINFTLGSGEKKSVTGPMLFTHTGITGPAVFELAAYIAFEKVSKENEFKIKLDPDANYNFATLEQALLKEISKNGLRSLVQVLMPFVPRHFAEIILTLSGTKALIGADLTKEERKILVHFLTGDLEITLIERTPSAEFVTAGGVNLEEVNWKTMESKLHKGLYFAGEVLNIDGLTGGFNLQSAWATGRSAGNAIIQANSKN